MSAIDDVKDGLTELGLPTDLAAAVVAALDAKGYDLAPKAGGSPVALADSTPVLVRSLSGRPGQAYAVQVGTLGWYIWMELPRKEGGRLVSDRQPPVFVPKPEGFSGDDPFVSA